MTRRVLAILGRNSAGHVAPAGHPESHDRVEAVLRGIAATPGAETVTARPAEPHDLELVHSLEHVAQVRELSETGGGWIDTDTFATPGTFDAACGAAGAGLVALDRLAADSDLAAAFVVTRPPGHHATATSARGFCFFNNIAIAAAHLVGMGARVAIVDWDVHHGNGTQDIFWSERDVLYISLHQEGLYPGTGFPHERGPMMGPLTNVNLPLPAGSTGDQYLRLLDDVAEPIVRRFEPDWILVSCGFDAHVDDPLADMALVADDFALFAEHVSAWAPERGRTVLFLEGGYDLAALESSSAAVLSALSGSPQTRQPSTGGRGSGRVGELLRFWSST